MKVCPFGVGFQERASNRLKRLSPKVPVVSVEGKRELNHAGMNQKDELP